MHFEASPGSDPNPLMGDEADSTLNEKSAEWGDRDERSDAWLRRERPPHW